MILRIIIIPYLLYFTSATRERCLTGYITDVESWIDENGNLTKNASSRLTIDVSDDKNAEITLYEKVRRFKCTEFRSVKYLSFARCQLKKVPSVFDLTDSLNRALYSTVEYITWYGNQFQDIPSRRIARYDVFLNVTLPQNTGEFGFETREFNSIWAEGFKGVTFVRLKKMDLRACGIRTIGNEIFIGMKQLEALYLSENNILFIQANAFAGLGNLLHLDISGNKAYDEYGNIKTIAFESVDIFKDLVNLQSLDFSFTKLTQRNLMIFKYFTRKLQRLSLCETGIERLKDNALSRTSLKYLDVSGNMRILDNPHSLAGLENMLEVLYANRVGLNTFVIFENFSKLEILKLSNNEIPFVNPREAETLTQLQILDLDENRITTWFHPVYSLMPNLKFLSVRYNNINMISDYMIEDFQKLSYVGFSGNFVICNCFVRQFFELTLITERDKDMKVNSTLKPINIHNSRNFSNFHKGFDEYNQMIKLRTNVSHSCENDVLCDDTIYKTKKKGSFLLFDYDPDLYLCMSTSEIKKQSYSNMLNCNQTLRDLDYDRVINDTGNLIIVLIVISTLIVPLLIFVYAYKRSLRYFCLSVRNSAMLSLMKKNEDIDEVTIYNYDVFVSYCNDDRSWILDHLLPHLETDCRVSVCLHERDFQVGLSILENIVSCMDRSRAIMLIISEKFLLSQWCQFEMHLAQHRLLETRREDLILVLLEDIPRRLRPNTLHYLMLTKTYIVWPKDKKDRTSFWKRLSRSIVAQKQKEQENNSFA